MAHRMTRSWAVDALEMRVNRFTRVCARSDALQRVASCRNAHHGRPPCTPAVDSELLKFKFSDLLGVAIRVQI